VTHRLLFVVGSSKKVHNIHDRFTREVVIEVFSIGSNDLKGKFCELETLLF
jgi:hypothetical protein